MSKKTTNDGTVNMGSTEGKLFSNTKEYRLLDGEAGGKTFRSTITPHEHTCTFTLASVNWAKQPWRIVISMAAMYLFQPVIMPILIIVSRAKQKKIDFVKFEVKS